MENLIEKFKPGDRAIVVSSGHYDRIGKYVTILDCTDGCVVLYDDDIGTTMTYPGGIRGKISRGDLHSYEHITSTIVGLVTTIFTNKIYVVTVANEKNIGCPTIVYASYTDSVHINQTVHLKGYCRKNYFVATEIL